MSRAAIRGCRRSLSSKTWVSRETTVYQALPSGGALLVCEKMLDDDRAGPRWAQLQSLNMLVCTDGKERTAAEYEALLREAGFSRVEARRTSVPLDAILAIKAG